MANTDILDIVDDNDIVIGQDTRENIHKLGLLHREIHIWFITPDYKIIFQHRAKNKDTYPDLLDATVGGHVDLGMSYIDTAIKEALEETGVAVGTTELHLLKKIKTYTIDSVSELINNSFKVQYGYVYKGKLANLRIESSKAIGFEEWPIDTILKIRGSDKRRFIPSIYSQEFLEMFENMKILIK